MSTPIDKPSVRILATSDLAASCRRIGKGEPVEFWECPHSQTTYPVLGPKAIAIAPQPVGKMALDLWKSGLSLQRVATHFGSLRVLPIELLLLSPRPPIRTSKGSVDKNNPQQSTLFNLPSLESL